MKNCLIDLERATGIEPVLPTWESEFSILYFQYLQNASRKINVHALHTVHALLDFRIAGGRLGGRLLMAARRRGGGLIARNVSRPFSSLYSHREVCNLAAHVRLFRSRAVRA